MSKAKRFCVFVQSRENKHASTTRSVDASLRPFFKMIDAMVQAPDTSLRSLKAAGAAQTWCLWDADTGSSQSIMLADASTMYGRFQHPANDVSPIPVPREGAAFGGTFWGGSAPRGRVLESGTRLRYIGDQT